MLKRKSLSGSFLAGTAATLLISGCAGNAAKTEHSGEGHKGHSNHSGQMCEKKSCSGKMHKDNACAGKNACPGKGQHHGQMCEAKK
jgi:hypothetical protein